MLFCWFRHALAHIISEMKSFLTKHIKADLCSKKVARRKQKQIQKLV